MQRFILLTVLSCFVLSSAFATTLTVPMRTPVPLVLLHHVNSEMSRGGDLVWLEVESDVSVEGRVVIAAGSHVEGLIVGATGAQSLGRGGTLVIEPRVVMAVDGSTIPLEGRFEVSGREKRLRARVAFGGLGALATRGDAAHVETGTRVASYVSVDREVSPTTEPREAVAENSVEETEALRAVTARVKPERYWFSQKGSSSLKALVISIDTENEDPLDSLHLVAIGGRRLPRPIEPESAIWESRGKKIWRTFEFAAWDFLKYFRGDRATEQQELLFVGRTRSGSELSTRATVEIRQSG